MPAMRELMLEVLTRRYYRIRDLQEIAYHSTAQESVFSAEYDHEGRRVHASRRTRCRRGLTEAIAALGDLFARVPEGHDIVLDVHAWRDEPLSGPEVTVHAVRTALDAAGMARAPARGGAGGRSDDGAAHGGAGERPRPWTGAAPLAGAVPRSARAARARATRRTRSYRGCTR